ncbi:MAG TPA: DUF4139 domain-containing protein [Sulfurospirillum arcachonense]|nr:DUF4139 domain-containing protein [Sulfurospirillum arcachonense]HIP44974.1 DUF4139 domain-containing protein [Sulfurospirillum arcachonense]
MKNLLLLSVTGISLFASSLPLHVELDIYSNKAFLSKTYELSKEGIIKTKVPINTKIENIRYTLPKKCTITNSTIEKLDNKELVDQKTKLIFNIEALQAKGTLLKTLSLQEVKSSIEIETIANFLVENLTKNSLEINSIKEELKELDKKIKKVTQELKVEYTCTDENKDIKITYPQGGIRYTPFYDISANIPNKSLTIEKKATLFYRGGENHEKIDLNIYSYRYNQNVAPQHFYPQYLGQKRKILYAKKAMAMESVQKFTSNMADIQHIELSSKSLYKIKGVKLKVNENNLLHVDKEIVNADFKTVIDAYGSNRAYIEAIIKTKKDYSGANANYFLNQNPIAARYMSKIQKNRKTRIYFGEDEHIQIKKELIKTLDEKTFFGDKKISTQNWKYSIINTKPYPTDIEFITRVPVSKDGDIIVKTLAQPKFDSQSAKGKTIWNFKLNSNTKKDIIFGYEVSNSK